MKIINNEKGYASSIILLILIIPIITLMIITMEEYSHNTDNTIETIESEKIKSKTEDFEKEIIRSTKESLHEVTLHVITTKKSLTDSKHYLKNHIEQKLQEKKDKYENINITSEIISITPSDNPFQIEITYQITSTINNSDIKINKKETKSVAITDSKYPVYDPLPVLKTGATIENNKAFYHEKLADYINLENSTAYINSSSSLIIKKCPYEDYKQHGNSNNTLLNCIHNHYYHNSHDGMCLLCRLENKTGCNHYGFETFIIPTLTCNKAPTSIDHVLLNDKNDQYMGDKISIDNQTLIYLDNGHKTKYGL